MSRPTFLAPARPASERAASAARAARHDTLLRSLCLMRRRFGSVPPPDVVDETPDRCEALWELNGRILGIEALATSLIIHREGGSLRRPRGHAIRPDDRLGLGALTVLGAFAWLFSGEPMKGDDRHNDGDRP
jgi:hypothetical protein